jgi:hypothetical protein
VVEAPRDIREGGVWGRSGPGAGEGSAGFSWDEAAGDGGLQGGWQGAAGRFGDADAEAAIAALQERTAAQLAMLDETLPALAQALPDTDSG